MPGQGALSGSILALTFSNKAAEEMRERLSDSHQDAAIEMWVGIFHAFGAGDGHEVAGAIRANAGSQNHSIRLISLHFWKPTSRAYRCATTGTCSNPLTSWSTSCRRSLAAKMS
ncbi:UvrD-helicase domain-containing protein [Methylocystis sp. H62]|uniref:UvrD-helicase domain-containing protein n=1 Tax=Methylocystis sp. H62 TaxID=2785789 RepID=UPI0018C2307F|nr:UvrD-helicase domain-containing protein [Methylocystis sp. H62]